MPSKHRVVRASRIGALARTRLEGAPLDGHVTGRFSQGLNLSLRNPNAFIPLQTPVVPLHPYAVEIEGPPLVIEAGTPVRVKAGHIAIGGVRIDLSSARTESLGLDPLDAEQARRTAGRLPIVSAVLRHTRAGSVPDPFERRIAEVVHARGRTRDPRALTALVGLGGGATPSGDDLLVGLAAGLTMLETVSPSAHATLVELRQALLAEVWERTALASAQMLTAVLARQVPEPLRRLATVLGHPAASPGAIRAAAERVSDLGARSGSFFLQGFLLAWRGHGPRERPCASQLNALLPG
jgi:hypothetical protein